MIFISKVPNQIENSGGTRNCLKTVVTKLYTPSDCQLWTPHYRAVNTKGSSNKWMHESHGKLKKDEGEEDYGRSMAEPPRLIKKEQQPTTNYCLTADHYGRAHQSHSLYQLNSPHHKSFQLQGTALCLYNHEGIIRIFKAFSTQTDGPTARVALVTTYDMTVTLRICIEGIT